MKRLIVGITLTLCFAHVLSAQQTPVATSSPVPSNSTGTPSPGASSERQATTPVRSLAVAPEKLQPQKIARSEKPPNSGFDGRFRFDPKTVFSFQVLGTTTRRFFYDPDRNRNIYRTGNALAYYMQYDKAGRHFSYNLSGSGRTRDYRAEVGFTRRPNTNREDFTLRYQSEPNPKANIISWRLYNNTGANFDWQGRMQNWVNETQLRVNLQRETVLNMGFFTGYERLFEEEFGARRTPTRAGAFAGHNAERSTSNGDIFVYGDTTPFRQLSASFSVDYIWNAFDLDFGAGQKFPRVSPAVLTDPDAPSTPAPEKTYASYSTSPTSRRALFGCRSITRKIDSCATTRDGSLSTIISTRYVPLTNSHASPLRVPASMSILWMPTCAASSFSAGRRIPEPPSSRAQRRLEPQRLQPLHRPTRTRFPSQRANLLHQNVLPHPQEFLMPVKVIVIDKGTGFTPEFLPHLFD